MDPCRLTEIEDCGRSLFDVRSSCLPFLPCFIHSYNTGSSSNPGLTVLVEGFCRSALLAIPHRKGFAAIPSVSLVLFDTRIATFRCHTNRSLKLPSFGHVQDRFLTSNKEKCGKYMGLCFARFLFLMFHRTIRIRIRIATESRDTMPLSSPSFILSNILRRWVRNLACSRLPPFFYLSSPVLIANHSLRHLSAPDLLCSLLQAPHPKPIPHL